MKDLIIDFYPFIVIYYTFYGVIIFIRGEGVKTKKNFWLLLTPLSIIIYPILWIVKYYKTLK